MGCREKAKRPASQNLKTRSVNASDHRVPCEWMMHEALSVRKPLKRYPQGLSRTIVHIQGSVYGRLCCLKQSHIILWGSKLGDRWQKRWSRRATFTSSCCSPCYSQHHCPMALFSSLPRSRGSYFPLLAGSFLKADF